MAGNLGASGGVNSVDLWRDDVVPPFLFSSPSNVAIQIQAWQHAFRFPIFLHFFDILCCLVFTLLGVVIFENWSGFKKDYLGDTSSDHEWYGVISRIVGNFHSPAVKKSDITPAGALTDLHEVSTHT